MDYNQEAINKNKEHQGQLSIKTNFHINSKDDLSVAYSPGVAAVCKEIKANPQKWRELTWRGNLVGVITDGSAVLGLGNIGASAGIPVMEGKAALMKTFAGADAIPIGLTTQDPQEIITTIRNISDSFGAINLEDIKAPECFMIEEALQDLGIPVFHDDQHGTAIAVLAGLKNALKRTNKNLDIKIVISGAGAAGIAIANLLLDYGIKNISLLDSKGVVSESRNDLNEYKKRIAQITKAKEGSLQSALVEADVFIGVSKGGLLTTQDIATMNNDAIVFSMANPIPELPLEEAEKSKNLAVYGTGRSDYPNQINNAVVFPGLFKGLLDAKATKIDRKVFLKIADLLADMATDELLPPIINKETHQKVAQVVKDFYA